MTEVLAPTPEWLRYIELNPAFRKIYGTIPPSALQVPSMMSVPEKRFLYGLAARYYEGEGVIVDAGIFLAASTRCFGEGIQTNPARAQITAAWPKPIVSFEKASINPGMPAFFARNKMTFTAEVGESFESEVRRNIEPVQDLVDLRIGDIMETAARFAQPVEILFLDVLKLPEISKFVIKTFFPRLIPNRSIVIQQDYFYERLPYIKTHQEMFKDYFEFVGEVGSTGVYLCTKAIPEEAFDEIEAGLTAEDQLKLASIAMQRSHDPGRRFMMAVSKLRLIRKLKGKAAASTYLDFIRDEFPEQVETTKYSRLADTWKGARQVCGRDEEDE